MQVHSAVMLDENEVADHNCPTVLLASSEEALLNKVREYVKANGDWYDGLDDDADVDTLTVDDINGMLGETAPELFIHTSCEEV